MKRIFRIMFTFIAVIAGILTFEWILYSITGANGQIQLFDKPQFMAVLAIISIYIALWPVSIYIIIYPIVYRKFPAAKTVAKSLVGVLFSVWTMLYALSVIIEMLTTTSIGSGPDALFWIFILYSIFMIASLFIWAELFPDNFTKIGESIGLKAVTPRSEIAGSKNIEIETDDPKEKTAK